MPLNTHLQNILLQSCRPLKDSARCNLGPELYRDKKGWLKGEGRDEWFSKDFEQKTQIVSFL